jgi:DNA-binding CsgD family transcriptional regulator
VAGSPDAVAGSLDAVAGSLDRLAGEPLPLPASLLHPLGQRIRALPEPVRDVLLHIALHHDPTVSAVRAALGAEPEQLTALTAAEESGVIRVDGDRIRFSHPLLACAAHALASRERRQRAHRRLAAEATDVEERARHLALARAAPDPGVAGLVEAAAGVARRRGRPDVAADLLALARRHTPDTAAADALRRTIAAAECLFAAGDTGTARALLDAAVERAGPGADRVRALLALAEVLFHAEGPLLASEVCRAAVRAAGDNPAGADSAGADSAGADSAGADSAGADSAGADSAPTMPAHPTTDHLAEAHLAAARYATHDARSGYDHARAALDLLRPPGAAGPSRAGRPHLEGRALAGTAWHGLLAHGRHTPAQLDRATRLLAAGPAADASVGAWLSCHDPAAARDWFQREYDTAAGRGDERRAGGALANLAAADCRLGHLARAREQAERAVEALELTGQRHWLGFGWYVQALVLAHLGETPAARDTARAGLARAERAGDPYLAALHLQVLGFADLSDADPESADRHLTRAADLVERIGLADPGPFTFHGDQIEAVTVVGDRDRARRLLTGLREHALRAPRPWLATTAARAAAVVAAAEGDLGRAVAAARSAIQATAHLPMPFERGRALLVYGRILRAQKSKRPAHEILTRARAAFDGLGARQWAVQAAEELDRCGLRRAGSGELTPTEQRIAALVAAGLTNGEAAARLYLSVKTVEANLTRIYRKLGVRGRRDLVHAGFAEGV